MNIVTFPNTILREQIPEFDFKNPSIDPVQLEKDNDRINVSSRWNRIGC